MSNEIEPRMQFASLEDINQHGFTHAMTMQQSLSVLIVLFDLTEVLYMVTSTGQPPTLRSVVCLSVIVVTFIGVVVLWLMTTAIDPTDPVQLKHRMACLNKYIFLNDSEELDSDMMRFRCKICSTYVSQHSFHCISCNRCVEYFDHHCKWVNNCIGRRNYLHFFALVVISLLYLIEVETFNSLFLVEELVVYKVAVQWITVAINVLPILGLLYLVVLHLYLIVNKKSTVGLILKLRNNKISPISNQTVAEGPVPSKETGNSTDGEMFFNNNGVSLSTVGRCIQVKKKGSRNIRLAPLQPTITDSSGFNSP